MGFSPYFRAKDMVFLRWSRNFQLFTIIFRIDLDVWPFTNHERGCEKKSSEDQRTLPPA